MLRKKELKFGCHIMQMNFSECKKKRFGEFEEHEVANSEYGMSPAEKHFSVYIECRTPNYIDKPITKELVQAKQDNKFRFDAFSHVPTHIQLWGDQVLFADKKCQKLIEVSTNKIAYIWLNGQFIARVSNNQNETINEICLDLNAGRNEMAVLVEGLSIRKSELELCIRNISSSLYVEETTLEGDVPLFELDNLVKVSAEAKKFQLNVPRMLIGIQAELSLFTTSSSEYRCKLWSEKIIFEDVNTWVELDTELFNGNYELEMNFEFDDSQFKLIKSYCVTNTYGIGSDNSADLSLYLNSFHSEPSLVPLWLSTNENDQCLSSINTLLSQVSLRHSYSETSLLSLLWLWNSPNVSRLPAVFVKRIKSSILGYRYGGDEPGNDAMDFSRNPLVFYTAQYLAGELFPTDRFLCSERFGNKQMLIGLKRLEEALLSRQVTTKASMNDLVCLLTLFEMAKEKKIKSIAKDHLDSLLSNNDKGNQADVVEIQNIDALLNSRRILNQQSVAWPYLLVSKYPLRELA